MYRPEEVYSPQTIELIKEMSRKYDKIDHTEEMKKLDEQIEKLNKQSELHESELPFDVAWTYPTREGFIDDIMEMHGQTREEVIEGLKKCPNLVFREDILARRNKK